MSHARQQIREAFVTRVTGLTTTGNRVYNTRVYPSAASAMPGITVFNGIDELSDKQTLGKREERKLGIIVEARAKPANGAGDVDDVLDQICAEVQAAVMAAPTLGNKVRWIELVRTEFAYSGELERAAGVARMFWQCWYYVLEHQPETLIYDVP